MENKYMTLNKKLDNLQKKENIHPHMTQNRKQPTQPRIINLTNIKLTQIQIQFLNLGPNYTMEQEPKKYINELIIDTENAIRHLEHKIHIGT